MTAATTLQGSSYEITALPEKVFIISPLSVSTDKKPSTFSNFLLEVQLPIARNKCQQTSTPANKSTR